MTIMMNTVQMYIFKFFLLLLFVTQLASSTLDDIDKNLISNHFNNYVDQGKLPNISILITKDAKEIYRHVYGYSDIKNKKKATKNTIYRIYSMTKPITGVAIMQLVEKGKIRLNDKVSLYIPAFKFTNVIDLDYENYVVAPKREVTIRDLLTHTSG